MSNRYPLDTTFTWETKADVFLQYAEVYKDCIQLILERYNEKPPFHDFSLAPVLFLFRQYIELQLKGIIFFCTDVSPEEIKHHDIGTLYGIALKAGEDRYGLEQAGEPNADAERFIIALAKFDPSGQAFRYPETSKGESFSKKIERSDGWLYENLTDLHKLSNIITETIGDLEGIEGYLDMKYESEQEAFRNK